ncbi:MAG: hypothetical protein IH892_01310, partial [Planctomycetes bacterium]|nr:hypothetical protein [Planctomycetota bacterium]
MCRTLMCLVSLVLVLGALDVTQAELIGHWTLDETSGTMAVDSSGRGHHGTYVNSPGLNTPGVFGTGMDSSGGYMAADLGADLPILAEERTIAVWVNPITVADAKFISYGNAGNGGAFTFTVENVGGQDGVLFRHNGGNMFYPGILMNEWNHTAMRVSPGTTITNDLEFFINGENVPGARNAGEDRPLVTNNTAFWVGTWLGPATPFAGTLDDAYFFDHALTDAEIRAVMNGAPPGQASQPDPDDEAADVARDSLLNWQAGEFAAQHDVYFGIRFDDINDATTTEDPVGVYRGRQSEAGYAPGRLAFDQTYYWRVDEVNSPPDNTVFKGEVWSFTAEPFAIPIENVTATASSSFGVSVAENTVNGSGLLDDLHGISAPDMWISAGIPATIEYAFDRAHKLHELWVWNSNQSIEAFVGFGAKDVVIEHSLDGENWTVLDGVGPLAQAPGAMGYAHTTTIDFGGAVAQHVRVTVNSVHGIAPQASLSEVRFFFIPTFARRPNPAPDATNVAPDTTLSWARNGREADRHEVYFGTNANDLALAGAASESSFSTDALDLQLGQTYAWRVDEVNEAMDPSTWEGTVWSFTTVDTISVDDMESYKDAEFLEIWATWVDGFDDPANGSLVGGTAGIPETGIVHGGSQSLPLDFDNSAAAVSEATRTFDAPMDWTRHGVQGLVLYLNRGADNTGGGQVYVK